MLVFLASHGADACQALVDKVFVPRILVLHLVWLRLLSKYNLGLVLPVCLVYDDQRHWVVITSLMLPGVLSVCLAVIGV